MLGTAPEATWRARRLPPRPTSPIHAKVVDACARDGSLLPRWKRQLSLHRSRIVSHMNADRADDRYTGDRPPQGRLRAACRQPAMSASAPASLCCDAISCARADAAFGRLQSAVQFRLSRGGRHTGQVWFRLITGGSILCRVAFRFFRGGLGIVTAVRHRVRTAHAPVTHKQQVSG